MMEFYPHIKWVHVTAVIASGSVFVLRGLATQIGARWPMVAPVRYLSYTIDTILLTAALMLLTILPGAIFANGWLVVKLVLLVAYIVLGTYALTRARTARVKLICFLAAILTYVSIIAVARSHHPLGPLLVLLD